MNLETLPYSREAEEGLLSCCLIDGIETLAKCIEAGVRAEDFHVSAHNIIFAKLAELFVRRVPISLEVVAEELRAVNQIEQVGGYAALLAVSSKEPTTLQSSYYITRVRELSRLRSIILTSAKIIERGNETSTDIEQFTAKAEQEFFDAVHLRGGATIRAARDESKKALGIIKQMIVNKGVITGVGTGFRDLDSLLSGFQRKEMIILAARPSMGKTALALNFADAAVLPKRGSPVPTLFFSLEMSTQQLLQRMICARGRVNARLLREGLLPKDGDDFDRASLAQDEISNAPLYIDESSGLSITQLRAKARLAHIRHELGLIIVDYLQLLSPTDAKMPREQQVAEASRGLKALAKELDVPVIVLSQLNRSSEKENRVPKLADLRESGAIEQDADVVMMLTHPRDDDIDEARQVVGSAADLIVAKQRNGPVGDVKLTFLRDTVRFENFSPRSL